MSRVEILHSSGSQEWFTPKVYIEAVRKVLGRIDLDPASCPEAQQVVQARQYYTWEKDGLSQSWSGRVFLNPPYGKTGSQSNQALWLQRLVQEYKVGNVIEAILLTNAQTAEKWFQPLWQFPICFTDHRIRFETVAGKKSQPTHGNAFTYLGYSSDCFERVFGSFGTIVKVR